MKIVGDCCSCFRCIEARKKEAAEYELDMKALDLSIDQIIIATIAADDEAKGIEQAEPWEYYVARTEYEASFEAFVARSWPLLIAGAWFFGFLIFG